MQERFNRREAKPLLLANLSIIRFFARGSTSEGAGGGDGPMLCVGHGFDGCASCKRKGKVIFGPKLRGSGCCCPFHTLELPQLLAFELASVNDAVFLRLGLR